MGIKDRIFSGLFRAEDYVEVVGIGKCDGNFGYLQFRKDFDKFGLDVIGLQYEVLFGCEGQGMVRIEIGQVQGDLHLDLLSVSVSVLGIYGIFKEMYTPSPPIFLNYFQPITVPYT